MFLELLRHYHWEILSEQLNFKCLKNHPSLEGTTKFLKKTPWAREKTEAFYLYKYKQMPIPSDEEHSLPPRERRFPANLEAKEPATINTNDKAFFDDPVSGPKIRGNPPRNKKFNDSASQTRVPQKPKPQKTEAGKGANESSDPWAKWRS